MQKHSNWLKQNLHLLKPIIIDMCFLCNINDFSDRLPINMTYGENDGIFAWFSWTPQNSRVVIEFGKSSKPEKNFLIMILAHEIFHLMLRKNKKLMQKISKYSGSNRLILSKIKEQGLSSRIILEELIVSSFIPEGYLSEKHFKKNIKKISGKTLGKDLINWRKYIADKMRDSAKLYLKKKQTIDDTHIKEIIDIIKKIQK